MESLTASSSSTIWIWRARDSSNMSKGRENKPSYRPAASGGYKEMSVCGLGRVGGRKREMKRGSSPLSWSCPDTAVMGLDNGRADRQPDPHPFFLGRNKGMGIGLSICSSIIEA